jgi:hypothetical protein
MKRYPPSDVALVPESPCLNCGVTLVAAGTADPSLPAAPHPGDVTVCIRCAAVMIYDDHLRPRPFTDAEISQLLADPEAMNQIARMIETVKAIQFVKHLSN